MTSNRYVGSGGLSVIVRFHDIRRLRELERAIFSLAMQRYRPLHIHLCVQRFSEAEIAATRDRLSPILTIDGAPALDILNWTEKQPADARSALINLGINRSNDRYLSFLDYDDALYPEAYELLIHGLNDSRSAISFGGVCLKKFNNFDLFDYAEKKEFPFAGSSAIDLMRENFCPIQSFVVDLSIVRRHHMYFDVNISKNEDYDFLLRIVSQYMSDFRFAKTFIGEYYIKRDGSNTILTEHAATPESVQAWRDAEAFVEGRRRTTLVSEDVQRSLGIAKPLPRLTIRQLLDRYSDQTG